MKNKYKEENRIIKLVKSTVRIKAVLFLFLGLLFSETVKSQNCQIIDYETLTNIACYDSSTGEIDIVVLDPGGSYTFAWNGPAGYTGSGSNISSLYAGTYTLQIIDLNNSACIQDTLYTLTESNTLISTVNLLTDVECFGDTTGVAEGTVIGGTPFTQGEPYTYLWSNGDTTEQATGLWGDSSAQGVPFMHMVTFTDSLGCTITDSIGIINLHAEITGTVDTIANVSCFNACDAYAVLSSSGGVLQHTYFWSTGQIYNGSGPDTAFNLCYGGYNIIIEDAENCRKTVYFDVTQPDELYAQASQLDPITCYGEDDGIAEAFATGGTTPYIFVWDSLTGQLNDTAFNLTPGIHTVFVTDSNGCTASDTVIIQEPTQLEVVIVDSMTIYEYCSGTESGRLCAIASGGTLPYAYQWNDIPGQQQTPCAYNLGADIYTVEITDFRQCHAEVTFDLDSVTNSMNADSVVVSVDHVSCFGLYDGSISLSNVVGAVSPFTYTWSGPGGYTGFGSNISALYQGNYSVEIADINGCKINMNIVVDQPEELEYVTYHVISETCYGADNGQIWVNVTGGTGPYYYDNSFTGTFPIPVLNQDTLINDSLILNLSQGDYNIYITDANNCEGAVVFGGTWQEQVDSGVVVTLSGVSTAPTSSWCVSDGEAWIDWPYADPLFNYTWETLSGTVLGTIPGDDTISTLPPGDYNLVVHYADSASFGQNYIGCDLVEPFTIGGNTGSISANGSVVAESCYGFNDGWIILSPTTSVGGLLTLEWDTTTSIPIGSADTIILSASTDTIGFVDPGGSLEPGTYAVTITDSVGCQITEAFVVDAAAAITAEILEPVQPLCHGDNNGSAEIVVELAGIGLQSYSWNTTPIQTTAIATGLLAGDYICIVTDLNDCEASFSVTVYEPSSVFVDIELTPNVDGYHISCFNGINGEANAMAGGGTLPYDYEWLVNGQTTQIATNLSVGTDTCIVTDANGCADTATTTLLEPNYLNPNIFENVYSYSANGDTNEISCFGMSDGWVRSDAFGGIEPYEYQWVINSIPNSIVSTEYIADNLPAGYSYTLTITDKYDCVSDTTTSVFVEPVEFIANVTTINYGGPTHAPFTVNFEDTPVSNDPYSFEWNSRGEIKLYQSGVTLMTLDFEEEDLGENHVYLTVTNDSTGCIYLDTFFIEIQGIPEINNVFTPNGDGDNEVFSFGEYGMKGILDVQIFNRWGQLVYVWEETNPNENNESQAWNGVGIDGKDVPEGVYFYILKADGEDGYHYEKKGSITLLR